MKRNYLNFSKYRWGMFSMFMSATMFFTACTGNQSGEKEAEQEGSFSIETQFEHADQQLSGLVKVAREKGDIPRSTEPDGSIKWTGSGFDWTEGFWPGSCWMMYQETQDEKWKQAAIEFQSMFEEHKDITTSHDVGFVFNNSYGKAYKILGDEKYKQILLDASDALISRFNPKIGCIESWDHNAQWIKNNDWQYPVIIDNMMNLEMLFEAADITGDDQYYDIAVTHADTTMKYHYRNDLSTYHVVDYDTITGAVDERVTHQGYSDSSAWARGQAWGLYGYAMCYRYTNDQKYLDHAIKVADYNIGQWPDDHIPYWDYNAPDIPDAHRDASAAAIFASALIELSQHSGDTSYANVAMSIIRELSSDRYLADIGSNNHFLLKHCVGNKPGGSEIDVPLNYADYYYLEALRRAKDIE